MPFIDEHRLTVPAPAATVWAALTDWIGHTGLGVDRRFTRMVGTDPRSRSGTLPDVGATVPGFAVAESEPDDHLTLAGRHRFSRYVLTFTLTADPAGTILAARSSAAFPGPHGRVYRMLVIDSGAHRMIVRRMLRDIGRSAESR
ncbi:SRPBCC family protein [Nocardia sp. alder85J]|uniref:SRPBCC family protein n=1 Tax=Nocardia sp. alder85J TaxID=2862949 RepID=UPI001CD7C73D|nr:hypothetical protein [Nocardia sp. alder85J]MCX4091205.1 hypothetical protein [Nocardia sp. alder85J]